MKDKLLLDKDNALLSKQLVTILTDVNIDSSTEDFEIKEVNTSKLEDIFKELEFSGLLKKIGSSETIEQKCLSKGVKLTDQRRIIAKVMSESTDHPDVDELYKRVSKIDTKISIATVYRTVKLFEESGILTKHEFKGGKARYEELNEGHHDHLIDVKTGEIIEFVDDEIEKLQKKVAEKYGYKLVDHKLELYGSKIKK